ncbi:HNH endonuclease [Saccharothrix sp. AJ9571]|nr:HNH endonuclease [Saccharothrix sp. AJ9571]
MSDNSRNLSDDELAASHLDAVRKLDMAYAELLRGIAEMQDRGLDKGFSSLTQFQTEIDRITKGEALARERAADLLYRQRGPDPPPLAEVGEALANGMINREHVAEICKVTNILSDKVPVADLAAHQRTLLVLAQQARPHEVRKVGRRIVDFVEQNSKSAEDDDREQVNPQCELSVWQAKNGRWQLRGALDRVNAQTLQGLLGVLAKPKPKDAATGAPDPRSTAERQGDALVEILELAARCDDLPVQGGESATLMLRVNLDAMTTNQPVLVNDSTYVSMNTARRICCSGAAVTPAIFSGGAENLTLGRSNRTASKAQRKALAVRDHGCAFPGCTRTPKWTEPHHVVYWTHSGRTDLDNLVLLCGQHHRVIHHTDWRVHMISGRPAFYAPRWLDPAQTPQYNVAHRAPDRATA